MSESDVDLVRPKTATLRNRLERGFRIRLWIAGILAVIALLLYAANQFYAVVMPDLSALSEREDQTALQRIETEVVEAFRGFGIKSTWIERKDFSLPAYGKIRTVWKVYAPLDVPLASLNQELTTIAAKYNSVAGASENLKTGEVTVHIKHGNMVVFSVDLIPDPSKRRNGGKIAILFDGLEGASESEIDRLALSTEPIACVFEPTLDVYALYNKLKSEKKEMVFHFHINPEKKTEGRFEFHEDMPPGAIKRRIRFLLQNYPDVGAYYITTELVPGSAAESMEEELRAHGLSRVEIDDMVYLDRSLSEDQLSARMNDLAAISARRGMVIGVVRLDDGMVDFISDEMIRLRKKGFDCYRLGPLLREKGRLSVN